MGAYLCPGCRRTSRWCVCRRASGPAPDAYYDSVPSVDLTPAELAHEILLASGDTQVAFEAYCAAREALAFKASEDDPAVVALRAELASAPTAHPPHPREQSRIANLGRQGNPSNLNSDTWEGSSRGGYPPPVPSPCAHANSPLCDGSCLGCPHARGRE